jgi:hypothetical protein
MKGHDYGILSKLESLMKLRFMAILKTISHVSFAVFHLIAGGRALQM